MAGRSPSFARFEDAAASAIERGAVAGLVAAVIGPEGPVGEWSLGWSDADRRRAMTPQTVFALASMTKAVTAVGVMTLVEDGAIGLDDNVGRWVPHLAEPLVLKGFDERGEPMLRRARRPVTLRHLLTHSSGLGHEIWSGDLVRHKAAAGIPPLGQTNASLAVPLLFDPGARWEYSIGLEWAGKVAEAVTGAPLGALLAHRVTEPLGMADTEFGIAPRHGDRVASVFARAQDGSLAPVEFAILPGEYQSGGGGLYGTPQDYGVFLRMILNEGRHGERAVLRPETVRSMQEDQLGSLRVATMATQAPQLSHDFEPFFGLDAGWNLAGMAMRSEGPDGRPAGSWGWGGLTNGYYWVDPHNKVAGLVMSQTLPFGDPTVLDLFGALERDVYQREKRSP